VSDQVARFQPTVTVVRSEYDGSYRMEINWDDSCTGEIEYNEEYDEEEEVGHTDFCDEAYSWLMDVAKAHPALHNYPMTKPVFDPGMFNTAQLKVMPGQAMGIVGAQGNIQVMMGDDGMMKVIKDGVEVHPDLYAALGIKGKLVTAIPGPVIRTKLLDNEGNLVDAGVAGPARRRLPFPTCVFFLPPDKELEDGTADPPANLDWPYDRYLPYGTCTNKTIVGPNGFGVCRAMGAEMPSCGGYKPDEPVLLGSSEGPTPVTIKKLRTHSSRTEWIVETPEEKVMFRNSDGPAAEQAMAYKYFTDLTGEAPVPPEAPEPPAKPSFLRSVVGAAVR
jgi:hypothetical protein